MRNLLLITYFTFLFGSTTLLNAAAPELSADSLEFDNKAKAMVGAGDAIFTHDELVMEADTVRYFKSTALTEAEGSVVLTRDTFRLVTTGLTYQVEERKFDTEAVRMGIHPFYVQGERLFGSPAAGTIEQAEVFFSEPERWSPSVSAQSMTYTEDGWAYVEKPVFKIAGVPVFTWPKAKYKIGETPVRFMGSLGARGNLGLFAQTESLYRIHENWFVGGILDLYTERGVLFGPAIDWQRGGAGDADWVDSEFRFGFLNDLGDPSQLGVDVLGRQVGEDRYYLDWRHRQNIGERINITSQIRALSDSEVEREFRHGTFENDQQPDSFSEFVYRGSNYFVSAFLRYDLTDYQIVTERTPEVRIDYLPSPILETGLYQSFQASYSRMREYNSSDPSGNITPSIGTSFESDRLDAYYRLVYPWSPTPWLTLQPVAGFRATHYDDVIQNGVPGNRSEYTRLLGEVGVDAEIRIHGTWDYENPVWRIDGLRHTLRPVAQFRVFPGGEHGSDVIIPVDDSVFTTAMPTLGLDDIRNIDDISDVRVLRVGLENLLQTRTEQQGARQLVELDFYQDIRLGGGRTNRFPGRDFSNFHVNLEVSPAYWIRFNMDAAFDPEGFVLQDLRSGFTLTDGDVWEARFYSAQLGDTIEQYFLDYVRELNSRWGLRARWRYDAQLEDFTEQVYALRQRIGTTWDIEYQIAFNSGSQREDDVAFRIRVDLLDW